MATQLHLQTEVLRWARERVGLSVAALAEKIKAKPEKVRAWEESGELTLAQAEKLAHVAHIPLGYLYFSTPPAEELPIPDFRTLDGVPAETSPDLLDTLYDALRKQEWYRDYLRAEGAEPVPFIGALAGTDKVSDAAGRIRSEMGLTSALEIKVKGGQVSGVLRVHIERIEAAGVLVLRNGVVGNNTHRPLSVEEFRGFALADEYAPLIFINGKDAYSAQVFTLMHELVHIWLGESGVSNPLGNAAQAKGVERFCNAVAAELLVPEREFRLMWDKSQEIDELLKTLVKSFKVSVFVLLRRARDLGLLPEKQYRRLYQESEESFRAIGAPKRSGGDFYATQMTRHGKPLVRALVASTLGGRTPYREAIGLLGMTKVQTFRELAGKLSKGGGDLSVASSQSKRAA